MVAISRSRVEPRPVEPLQHAQASSAVSYRSHESESRNAGQGSPVSPQAPELSLLALNATGEPRYLGPSSGSFFATYAASLARSAGGKELATEPRASGSRAQYRERPTSDHVVLSPQLIRFLARSFSLWTLPLYPLYSQSDLEALVLRYTDFRAGSEGVPPLEDQDMIIFYLIMAVGALNVQNTIRETSTLAGQSYSMPTAKQLHGEALGLFERCIRHFRPDISLIRILLLMCIYSSYGTSGISQWQLAGLAMRVSGCPS